MKKKIIALVAAAIILCMAATAILLATDVIRPPITQGQRARLQVGMTIDEVVGILGYSGNDVGSGTVILEYPMWSGKTLVVGFIKAEDCIFRVATVNVYSGQ